MTDSVYSNLRQGNNGMNLTSCYREAHLSPFVDQLRNTSAQLERRLRQARLPTQVNGGDEIYLPLFPAFNFLINMIRREGIDETPLWALGQFEITDFGEKFIDRVSYAPSLKVALVSLCDKASIDYPNGMFFIKYEDKALKLCMLNDTCLNVQEQYIEDWNGLLAMLSIVRAFSGPDWQPTEMAFGSTVIPGRYTVEQFPNTHFLTGQKVTWISVPYELLNMPFNVALAPVVSSPFIVDFQTNIGSLLIAALSAYLPEQLPTIEIAAEMAATSVRTLQRRLKKSALSYSGLIIKFRFETAVRLLRETDATVLEIALEVGYEDPSHFSRAFKRIAGITPREYRRQQRLHQSVPAHSDKLFAFRF